MVEYIRDGRLLVSTTAKRFLVKVGGAQSTAMIGLKPALASARMKLRPLFTAPATQVQGLAAAPAGPSTWFLAEPSDQSDTLAIQNELAGRSPWDLAHALGRELANTGVTGIQAIEPDLDQAWITEDPSAPAGAAFAAAPSCDHPEPQDGGVLPRVDRFAWHLESDFSGLKAARDAVANSTRTVTIAHLDTGYFENHKLLPEGLNLEHQRNFVAGEKPDDAHDPGIDGVLKNPGHGMGTLGILAGGRLKDLVPVPIGSNKQDINSGDFLGGAPRASIVPMRIANSVVHFSTSAVAEAIEAARSMKIDVISMSMGGLPSAAWADAVNAAYEAGIVIVCAAGNNFGGFPTSSIVYPARFQRVIAACGVMANDDPYFDLPPFVMQGCVGPRSKMATALSAYTPNIPWARWGCAATIDLNGTGTSAATPQIAAAAALWLTKHEAKYPKGWMRVAAVRKALFQSAIKAGGTSDKKRAVDDFLGQGILAANAALNIDPGSEAELEKWHSPPDSADFSLLKLITGLGVVDDPRTPLFELELAQLALTSKGAREAVPDPDLGASRIRERDRRRMLDAILDEGHTSLALRRHLEISVGRSTSSVTGVLPRQTGVPGAPIAAGGVVAPAPTLTPSVERRTVRPPPKHRRLQIFATDPGASNRLNTAFINRAVIKVPWEVSGGSHNVLQPGPVGEYVEVVDVDPASGRVYEPVDLNDPFLLAQDGHAPSVGNPQFHQQMVYAVAMKTIEHFEQALGRPILWASRRVKIAEKQGRTGTSKSGVALPQTTYEETYIKRLRIYPHALRQANAFYSPDKAALLFGYFPDTRGNGIDGSGESGGRIVFTCLSHDIVAHETTHAILDGLHRRYQEGTNPDVHAFHEALADIVAIFQHFTFSDVLAHQIQQGRGDLRKGELLVTLAQEFGQAMGYSRALRNAIGDRKKTLADAHESHERGSILVAAVFDAFLAVYRRRIDDLLRIATSGTGVLARGAIHPDLVARLADEAAKTASDVLTICIRALDYCPPVDINFGDYLRALITADSDLVAEDRYGYRVAFLEAFATREIYPEGVRSLSVESLRWAGPAWQPPGAGRFFREFAAQWRTGADRAEAYRSAKVSARALHGWIRENIGSQVAPHFGLDFSDPNRRFEVHSVRPARRVGRDGTIGNDIVVVITQSRDTPHDPDNSELGTFRFRGGCTLIVDADKDDAPIRYCVMKRVNSTSREKAQRAYLSGNDTGLHSLYFGTDSARREPFAMIHSGH
jgi:subtilisin family serine protease